MRSVVDGPICYDVVLNQCNITLNHNKYYRLQLLTNQTHYFCCYQWGRVGQAVSSLSLARMQMEGPFATVSAAAERFDEKYYAKTGHYFRREDDTASLSSLERRRRKGKYIPVDIVQEARPRTAQILPLGLPTRQQITQGLDALREIEQMVLLDKTETDATSLADASSMFYTLIPHSFGRKRPVLLSSLKDIRACENRCQELLRLHSPMP